MRRQGDERERGNVMEVHGLSREGRDVMLPRLYRVLAASGCWLVGFRRGTPRGLEYSFEIELNRSLELYCGLVQAGLEMTELSHRMLTELCVLRTHNRALSGPPRAVSVRLVISFVVAEDSFMVREMTSASA
jgi:hypothetical protein